VAGNLRIIVFSWAAAALGYNTTQASLLVGVVVVGTALGAVFASMKMRLDQATSTIPLGIGMGILVIALNFIDGPWVAAPFLILQGAGRSIAVQNFNEQACILALGAFYAGMTKVGLSAFVAITVFGLVVAGIMWVIGRWHKRNTVVHRDEVEHLLALARSDKH